MRDDLILTHGDLDGMVSAILLLSKLGAETPVEITNGEQLARSLGTIAERSPVPANIFISDLLRLERRAGAVEAALSRLRERGCALHLYDHHSGWDEGVRSQFSTFIVDMGRTTAAALVWSRFLNRDPHTRLWLRVLSEKEESGDPGIRDRFALLAALMQRRHWDRQSEALAAMARAEEPGSRFQYLVDWYRTVQVPHEEALAGTAQVLTAASGMRIGWVDLRAEPGYVQLNRRIVRQHGVTLVASVISKGVVLGADGIDRGPDLRRFNGTHEYHGVRFFVGGHKSPVRFAPITGAADGRFVAGVRAFLLEQL